MRLVKFSTVTEGHKSEKQLGMSKIIAELFCTAEVGDRKFVMDPI